MEIRRYDAVDRAECLDVAEGVTDFAAFLDGEVGEFFVMEHDGAVVGCGGYAVDGEVAELRWGMVKKDLRGNGLGRFLLMYRLREIGKTGARMVKAPPTCAAGGFLEKQGFRRGADGALWKKLAVCE